MIDIERLEVISDELALFFNKHATSEWQKIDPYKKDFYNLVDAMWCLRKDGTPLCVIGAIKKTLIGSGIEIFFFVCDSSVNYLRELILFLRRAFRRIVSLFVTVTVSIDKTFPTGEKFIKFFGFRNTGYIVSNDLLSYEHFELRKEWLL